MLKKMLNVKKLLKNVKLLKKNQYVTNGGTNH